MNHRGPKQRSICRYYSPENNSCYYGDACQFQHSPAAADHHPAQMSAYGMVQQQPMMAPIMPNRAVDPAAMRSHSSRVPGGPMAPIPPSGMRGMGRGSLPPQAMNSLKQQQQQDLRHGNVVPSHRTSGYKGSLIHHASNPPKRRMAGPGFGGGPMGTVNMSAHPTGKPHPGMLRNQPQRKDKEQAKTGGGGRNSKKEDGRVSRQSDGSRDEEARSDYGGKDGIEEKTGEAGRNEGGLKTVEGAVKKVATQEDVRRSTSEGSGKAETGRRAEEVGRSASSGYSFTALQPPPPSKLSKNKSGHAPSTQSQVQSGGTTYFYSGQQPSYAPDFTVYSGPMPKGSNSGKNSSSSASSSSSMTSSQASFFLSENLRQELQQQQLACLSMPVSDTSCPREVDKYHSLCPLEPVDAAPDQEVKRLFGHPSTCYRGICQKDGLFYCLRRIHGFRLTSPKAVQELDKWKQLTHVNLVVLKEMFTTKAFGDHSVVFVYDFHPAAVTLREKHSRHTKRPSALPEDLVWEYTVQLASAVRIVHSQQLALRCLDPSKVLVSSRQRIRVSGCGIMDVITYDSSSTASGSMAMHQQGDLYSLGQLLLCVSLQSVEAVRPDLLHRSMEAFATIYSPDLNHLMQYLLQSGSKSPPHSIMDVLSMVGGQMQFSLERSQLRADLLEQELSKELQNGRLFRVLAKLGTINERPEFANDEQWAETGDRYLLKLLRDYLFHQVHPSGAPWVNLAHVVQTLNKIDAGTYENVALHSRDEKSVLVVSYADLKLCLENSFSELLSASSNHSGTAGGRSVNGHTL